MILSGLHFDVFSPRFVWNFLGFEVMCEFEVVISRAEQAAELERH